MMDQAKPRTASTKSTLLQTFRNLVRLQPGGVKPAKKRGTIAVSKSKDEHKAVRNILASEVFIAKLFAAISATKAAYAQFQTAHFPHHAGAIQSSDESVVKELRILSELKREFSSKLPDACPPHVTIMLAEIQEQQSLVATFETALRSLEVERKRKDSKLGSLRARLQDREDRNKSIERKNGCFCGFQNVRFGDLNPTHFVRFLTNCTLKSIRVFVEQLVYHMETANWDLESAAVSIHSNAVYVTPDQQLFAFESFVALEMFEGFNSPHQIESKPFPNGESSSEAYFLERFNEFKSVNPTYYVASNLAFAGFTREKYLKLVHPKMEVSLFGNLKQRNLLVSGKCPGTAFFEAFAEMSKQVWLLHCLGRSFGDGARAFQVKKNCRFSEVLMESVNEQDSASGPCVGGDRRVAFTVVPGFRIGKVVMQCQVFLSPTQRCLPLM